MEFPPLNNHFKGRFTPEVEGVLRDAGWFPGRIVSNEQALKWLILEEPYDWAGSRLSKSGICQARLFPAAWRLLREFGGLTYKQKSDGDSWYQQGFTIDPLRGGWLGDDGWFLEKWIAGGALFPIGRDKESILAITIDGKVIDSNENLVGNTIDEAITNLVLNKWKECDYGGDRLHEASVFLGLVNTASLKEPYCRPLMQFQPLKNHYEGRFTPEVEEVLRAAGWFPGRTVSNEQALKWLNVEYEYTPNSWEGRYFAKSGVIQAHMFPAAWHALREFGGLKFEQKCEFDTWNQQGFTIDPLEEGWMLTDSWFIDEWCADGALFPLGRDNETTLAIRGDGAVIDSENNFVGRTIDEAIANLILIRRPKHDFDREKFHEASVFLRLVHENASD